MSRRLKHSGIEWIGEIPQEWGVVRLKCHVYEIVHKNNPVRSSRILSLTNKEGVIPYEEKGDSGNKSKEILTDYKLAYPDTIVVNSMNVLIGSVGKSSYFGCVSPVYYVFGVKDSANIDFVNYIFCLNLFQKNLRRYANGILEIRLRVSSNDILKQKIPLPPLPEQERIAGYLDERCSKIDALVANSKARLLALDEYRQALIAKAVTKGLDEGVVLKDSGIEWIGDIPQEWGVVPNKYLMKKVKEIIPRFNGERILSLTMEGVIERDLEAGGKIPASFDGYQKINAGNLLMCLFDIDVTPRCIGLITQDGITSPAYSQFTLLDGCDSGYYYYLYLFLDNNKILLPQAKNLRHSLTEDVLGEIPMPLPPLPEQERIAGYLDERCARIDKLKATIEQTIEVLAKYKQSLIFEYVTGKREVPACFGGEDSDDK